ALPGGRRLAYMYFLYSLALTVFFLALFPYFIYQAARYGKYASSFRQRMGFLPESLRPAPSPVIWIHAVSVGEFNAARPLIASLKESFPQYALLVSTTTITGQRLARESCASLIDGVFYFPFDWAHTVRRALDRISPDVVIILETELWPNFLRECRRRNLLTIVANGRISPRSYRRYLRARPFIARVLEQVSLFVMQSDADAERARALGAPSHLVRACGNLKYDLASLPSSPNLIKEIDERFALSAYSRVIVAGSTAPGEEKILLDSLARIRAQVGLEDARLVIAPRHPERFDEVASLVERSGFRLARRSRVDDRAGPSSADVVLLDSIGELTFVYRFASVVFVGGSLVPRGGHNIIEPAACAKPIIVGPHTENFRQIVSDFAAGDALIQLDESGEAAAVSFAREAVRLLNDRRSAEAMGRRASEILSSNRGATRCTVEAIIELMRKK
ncbi:MAG TPA: 3-deoxy-D-manno-octulosonic acid transferase, partial [Blastocatellia bacterium]|nr:3-deoxy-D-manno-octulosonic acid transferase [Blastocatellia bacterium]